ncbi:hypothetical protein HELRODRAFT_177574 [Helobdella robusta]|uniref:Receptor ligand binding region domain-containing protein n=1 Tax=Helobdella robusta TaxID=6412 RepID=T1FBW1_HELRO|nr:hypothetical protein HELRODRAFT_177574 [Helobdella robusta]ESN97916.1 hypothetical protein HELRODRAFT_177574 [Helobdella robusta]
MRTFLTPSQADGDYLCCECETNRTDLWFIEPGNIKSMKLQIDSDIKKLNYRNTSFTVKQIDETKVVRVLALLPSVRTIRTTSFLMALQRIAPAIDLAVQNVNTGVLPPYYQIVFKNVRIGFVSSLLKRLKTGGLFANKSKKDLKSLFKLEVVYRDDGCQGAKSLNHAVEFYKYDPVNAIIGPACDYAVASVARQCVFWNLPVLTGSGLAKDFGVSRLTEYSTLTRLGPRIDEIASIVLSIIRYYNWNKVAVVYELVGFPDITDKFCHFAAAGIKQLITSSEVVNHSSSPNHRHHDAGSHKQTSKDSESKGGIQYNHYDIANIHKFFKHDLPFIGSKYGIVVFRVNI